MEDLPPGLVYREDFTVLDDPPHNPAYGDDPPTVADAPSALVDEEDVATGADPAPSLTYREAIANAADLPPGLAYREAVATAAPDLPFGLRYREDLAASASGASFASGVVSVFTLTPQSIISTSSSTPTPGGSSIPSTTAQFKTETVTYTPSARASQNAKHSGGGGLSGGSIAGIVIAVVVGLGLLAGLAFFFFRRHNKKRIPQPMSGNMEGGSSAGYQEKDGTSRAELHDNSLPYEAAGKDLQEMPVPASELPAGEAERVGPLKGSRGEGNEANEKRQ